MNNEFSGFKFFFGSPFFFKFTRLILERSLPEFAVLSSLIRMGDVVFDVGANNGGYSILFANLVGEHGCVHAFEAVPPTFETLFRNVSRARMLDRVRLNRFAISDHQGISCIHVPGTDLTEASLKIHDFASWETAKTQTYLCKLETLDTYAETNGIQHIDFVNLDVEGAELLVLQGMKSILEKRDAPMLMLEIFPRWMKDFGFTINDLYAVFSQYGYNLYFIGPTRLVLCENPQKALALINFPSFLNFICTKRLLRD